MKLEVLLDAKVERCQPDVHPLQGTQGSRHLAGSRPRDFHIEIGIIDNEGSLGHVLVRLEEREKEAHDSFLLLMFQEKGKVHGDQISFRVGERPGAIDIGHGDFGCQARGVEGGQENHGEHQKHTGNARHGRIVESQLGEEGGVAQELGAQLGQDIADDGGNGGQGECLYDEEESDMYGG